MSTYFTSDTHYGHKNIVRGTSEWENKDNGQRVRDFDTMEEHNDALVKSINALVKENDELWHLGDWSFGGFQNIIDFRKKLNCKNIHLVFGNHDHHIERNKEGVQGYFKSVQYYKELSLNSHRIIMSHYAMRVWNKSHHGSIMLYGHSHGTLDEFTIDTTNPTWIGDQYFIKNYRTMDVGMDTNNLYPYHLDEIIDKMKARDMHMEIDHHNSKTN